MILLIGRASYLDSRNVKLNGAEFVSLIIKDRTPRTGLFLRIYLKKVGILPQIIRNLIPIMTNQQRSIGSDILVKKSVRIDNDLFQALLQRVGSNELFISKTVADAVIQRLNTRTIDLIETCHFRHKITVYFTQEQYRLVEQAIAELKNRGFTWVTFSLLVRSILYEQFELVQELKANPKQRNEVA